MRALPWFHMYHEARTDRKLARLSDREHRLWFNLLCYAAEQDQRGTIPPISEYLLSVEIGADGVEEVECLINCLVSLRILSRDVTECHEYVPLDPDDELDCHVGVTFINFERRNSASPSDLPEATRERKQRQREREKQAQNEHGHEHVTPVTILEKSREEKKREEDTPPLPPETQAADAALESGYRQLLGDDYWSALTAFKQVDANLSNGWLDKALKRAPPGLSTDQVFEVLTNALNRIGDDFQRNSTEAFIHNKYGWANTIIDEEFTDMKGITT